MGKINVIIPSAGLGTRLRPHTLTTPKVLLPVAGQPILGHILDRLADVRNLGAVHIVVGFLGERVEAFVREKYDFDVHFVYQPDLRGLGSAFDLALREIRGNDPILGILGDTILDVDLDAFMSGPDDTLGVKEVDDPRRFGVVELDGQYVRRLVEKPANPPTNWAVVGLYGIQSTRLFRECLGEIVGKSQETAGEIQLTDALELMVRKGSRMRAVSVDGWYDCGKLETLLATNRHLLDKQGGRYDWPGAVVIPPVYLAPTAVIERSVIGPYVSVGERARISDAVIRNSIVADEAQVRSCVLEDSMIGPRAIHDGNAEHLNVGDSSGAVAV